MDAQRSSFHRKTNVGSGRKLPARTPTRLAVWELFVCRTSAGCTSGAPLFGLQTGGACSEIQSSAGIADGAYHHLAGTYDGSSLKIYVDGTLQGTLSAPGITVDVTNGLLVIG